MFNVATKKIKVLVVACAFFGISITSALAVTTIGTGISTAGNITTTAGNLEVGGNVTLNGGAAIFLTPSATGSVTIGGATQTGTIFIGTSTTTNTIEIGNGIIAAYNTQTINVGAAGAANSATIIGIGNGSGTSTVTIGNTSGASSVAINTSDWKVSTTGLMEGIGNINTNGNINTSAATFNIANGTSTTINMGAAATSMSFANGFLTLGSSTKLATIAGTTTLTGDLSIQSTAAITERIGAGLIIGGGTNSNVGIDIQTYYPSLQNTGLSVYADGGTVTNTGINIDTGGSSPNVYGIKIISSGSGTSSYGIYSEVTNGFNRWAGYFISDVGIRDGGLIFSDTMTGRVIDATSYEVAIDDEATGLLHLNVPTGAGMEFSINDIAKMTLNSSGYFGVGTTSALTRFTVADTGTSTLTIATPSATQGACLEFKDSDGSGYTYVTYNNGAQSISSTSCK